ncbi:hypothetical protein AAON49_14015 [Pseudotenacibaculum sp. MALMAid0570]|uniref:hypothetical protein n=1 Tax=Pseudotenacibaculum sp. MALMAid0570 TaxID=3143938 RepID=UPI0032DE899F
MKKIFESILNKSIKNRTFVSVYSDQENVDKFSMGIVVSFDDDFLLLKKVSPEGNYDGFSILLIEYIYCIEFEDDYIKRKSSLVKENISEIHLKIQKSLSDNFRFDKAIKLSKEQNFLCCIDLIFNRSFIGYIQDFDDTNVVISNIDDNHKQDGYSLFRLIEIEKMSFFSSELISISNQK